MLSTNLTTEDGHQRALISWSTMAMGRHPELQLLFAIPNGGARSKATAGILKATGVRAGVPDLCLPVPRGVFHGLFIEMKVPARTGGDGKTKRAGELSPDQRFWMRELRAQGYRAEVCYGWDEARELLLEYLAS